MDNQHRRIKGYRELSEAEPWEVAALSKELDEIKRQLSE